MKNRQRISWKKPRHPLPNQPMHHTFWLNACPDGARMVCNHANIQRCMGGILYHLLLFAAIFYFILGGIWADRYNRKILIASADSLIAFVTLLMIFAIPLISSIRLYCPACLLCRPFVLSVQEFKPRQCKL